MYANVAITLCVPLCVWLQLYVHNVTMNLHQYQPCVVTITVYTFKRLIVYSLLLIPVLYTTFYLFLSFGKIHLIGIKWIDWNHLGAPQHTLELFWTSECNLDNSIFHSSGQASGHTQDIHILDPKPVDLKCRLMDMTLPIMMMHAYKFECFTRHALNLVI